LDRESQQANAAASYPKRSFLSLYGLAFTFPLGILYLLESFVIKALEVHGISGEVGLIPLLQAWSPDIAFAAATTVGLAAVFSYFGKAVKIPVAVVYYLLMAVMLSLMIASYGFFMSTGTNLSWSAIRYWAANYAEVSNVVAGEDEQMWVRFLIAYCHLGLVLLFAVLPHIPPVTRRLWRVFSNRVAFTTFGVGLLAAILFSLVPAAKGPVMAACQCVPLNIISDFVKEEILPEETVEIADNERLDASLEFEAVSTGPRLNVVLIMYESLRWKSSDAYFPGMDLTPFMAELAEDGMLIENQHTVVPHTTKAVVPICCGIYPYLDTTPKETLPGLLPRRCLPHILRSQGYRTAFFQPAANFEKREQLVSNMGYEVYKGLDDMPQEGFETTNYFGKEEHIMIRPSMQWVDSVKDNGPFLLTYLTLCTHHNYVTPQSHPYRNYPVDNDDLRNYMNAVRYTDDFLRDLFAEFKKRDLIDNTLFVIVGDHGEAFGEHGGWQHDLVMWEEGLHSFGLLYSPNHLPRGVRIDGFRSHVDIVPTVCDLLGLNLKKGEFVGSSILRPVPEGRKQFHSCWYRRRCLAVREGSVKTIFHYGVRPMEVYDNSIDPFDQQNLAHTGPYDEVFLREREEEMTRWVKVVNQQYREWEEALAGSAVSEDEPPVENRLHARFGDGIELIGYEIHPVEVNAGQDVRVKYVFKALKALSSTNRLFVHVVQGKAFLNEDHVPANGTYPLGKWKKGQYIIDEHVIHIPGTWRSGEAKVRIGFWDTRTRKRFPVHDCSADVDQNRLEVARVKVRGGISHPTVTVGQRRKKIKRWIGFDKPSMETETSVLFGDKVELVGFTLSRVDVELAGTAEISYAFRAANSIPASWKLTVKLIRDDGKTIDGDHVPIGGLYPPKDWRKREYVVDLHRIHIDMHRCKPGKYTVWLGFRAGSRGVAVEGELEADKLNRVKIGTVNIERGAQKKSVGR